MELRQIPFDPCGRLVDVLEEENPVGQVDLLRGAQRGRDQRQRSADQYSPCPSAYQGHCFGSAAPVGQRSGRVGAADQPPEEVSAAGRQIAGPIGRDHRSEEGAQSRPRQHGQHHGRHVAVAHEQLRLARNLLIL